MNRLRAETDVAPASLSFDRGLCADGALRLLYALQTAWLLCGGAATGTLAGLALSPVIGYVFGLFERDTCADPRRHLRAAVVTGVCLLAVLPVASAAIGCAGLYFLRTAAAQLSRRGVLRRRIAVLGASGDRLQGLFPEDRPFAPQLRIIPGDAVPVDFCRRERISELIVTDAVAARVDALIACRMSGLKIFDLNTFRERETGRVEPENAASGRFLFTEDAPIAPGFFRIKRAFDLLLLLPAGLIALPLIALGALAVRLSDGGPAFYAQRRTGRHGHEFMLYKLRTMRMSAEADGPQWASGLHDPRVTAVGRFLRRTRIDELPQLWCILRGEMSWVGPRPERPEFVEVLSRYIPNYRLRHWVPPGLTGWAQIRRGYCASVTEGHEKLAYDLYYIKYPSLRTDAEILLKTLRVPLFGDDA